MKKLLLTATAIAALSTSAFATDNAETTSLHPFYLRGDIGAAKFNETKYKSADRDNFTFFNIKTKTRFVPSIDLGVGYYITDKIRGELVFTTPFASKSKGSRVENVNNINASDEVKLNQEATDVSGATVAAFAAGQNVVVTSSLKQKPTVHALLARVSGDVVDLGMAKIFLTGGLGFAQVKSKTTLSVNVASFAAGVAVPGANYTNVYTAKAKSKNNLAYTIGAGAAFDVAEGVHLEVAYSWRDYGKTKAVELTSAKTDDTAKFGGYRLGSHNFTAGVRFDI